MAAASEGAFSKYIEICTHNEGGPKNNQNIAMKVLTILVYLSLVKATFNIL